MKKIIKVLVILILSIPLLWLLGILIWWMPWMGAEIPWYKLTETYKKVWDYSVWKQKWFYNICHKEEGCLNWELLWYKEIDEKTFVYIGLKEWIITSIDEKEVLDYYYTLYKKSNRIYANTLNDLPKFWYLKNNQLEFYSENELSNLSEEKRKIFKEWKKNPVIEIDGKKY